MYTGSIPLSLYKKGITMIEDNLLPGQEVNFGKMFCLIFRSELEARIFQSKGEASGRAQAGHIEDLLDSAPDLEKQGELFK